MKNKAFHHRLGFAMSGFVHAVRSESSFRFHVLAAGMVLALLIALRPAPMWWAVLTITIVTVLAAELFNTALEHLADHVRPELHPQIKLVKDCAAAAVLVASIGAIAVAAAFFYEVCF